MELELKTTDKGYSLSTDGTKHFLNFGEIRKGEKQVATIRFKDVTANTFSLTPACNCTTTNKIVISPTEVEYTISFSGNATLPKTVVITNNNKQTQLKLDGKL